MTTAHRPTFDPAKGKANTQAGGTILHTRSLPAHTQLKFRQKGQGGAGDIEMHRDLKTELLRKEEDYFNKTLGEKRSRLNLDQGHENDSNGHPFESVESVKRAKLAEILDVSKHEDDNSSSSDDDDPNREGNSESGAESGNSDSESQSDEDSEDELQRELEKIRQERAEQKLRQEQKESEREQEEREKEIAYGNPLLNPGNSNSKASSRRKWNDDVVFKNQAKGLDDRGGQGFINDMIRSDFHRKFMNKYIR